MTSFVQQFGLEENDLRQKAVSLAAYALSLTSHVFEFPVREVTPEQRGLYPAPAPDDELEAEAAMALLGAAGAAMVIDQQVGLALTSAAADRYWNAGHYYGAFLWSFLGVPVDRVFEVANDLAERGLRVTAEPGLRETIRQPAALVPEQLAYLAAGIAVVGDTFLASRLFDLVPLTTVIGPYALPAPLLRDGFTNREENQESARDVTQHLMASFDIIQRGMEFQPRHQRLLPWNVGFSPESVLLIAAFITRGMLAPQNLVTTGPYASALLGAAFSAAEILRQPRLFRDISVPDVLGRWLERG
jgi:hypothetical protein